MGLVLEDDGWRIPDALWAEIELHLPVPETMHPWMPLWSGAIPRCDEQDPVRSEDRLPVECFECDRSLFQQHCPPAISRVDGGWRF